MWGKILHFVYSHTEKKLAGELEEESRKRKIFKMKFPHLSSIPILGRVVGAFYALGGKLSMGLLVIVLLFGAINFPYLDTPMTGWHAMKYSAFAGPARIMVEKNNPFLDQQLYKVDPLNNPQGISKGFFNLPFLQWGLYITYKAFPSFGFEFNTRIFLLFTGILTLIFAYFFMSYWCPKGLAFTALGLIAINPIVHFTTFVSALDSSIILFMFISLIYLNNYIINNEIKYLYISSIIFGLSISIKYSIFLWYAPIGIALLFFKRKENIQFLGDTIIYILFAILILVAEKITFGGGEKVFYVTVVPTTLMIYLLYKLTQKYYLSYYSVLSKILKNKIYLLSGGGIFLIGTIILYRSLDMGHFKETFLTDGDLLFNLKLYKHMLYQFKDYMTRNPFILAIFGMIALPLTWRTRTFYLLFSFGAGAALYWILASKVIFFHRYYTVILMVTFCLLAGTVIYLSCAAVPKKYMIIPLLIFGIFVIPESYTVTIQNLNYYEDYSPLSRYIREHTDEKDIIYNQTGLSSMDLYFRRAMLDPRYLRNEEVRKDIRELGFANSMKKYNIRYLITRSSEPDFNELAPLFYPISPLSLGELRKFLILEKIGGNISVYEKKEARLEEIALKYKIKEKFKLEAEIGRFKVFTFLN
jgi:hypothetical protein